MRHAKRGRKLGRTTSHRLAMFRNQLASLVTHGRITTTLPKAKELRRVADRVVTHGKDDTVPARRWVARWIPDRDLVKKVFHDIGPRFAERPGGYTRIVKLGARHGDGAELAILEFVDYEKESSEPEAKPAKKARAPKASKSTKAPKATKAAPKATAAPKAGKSAKGGGKSAPSGRATAKKTTAPKKTTSGEK